MTCNLTIDHEGHWNCSYSVIGCLRTCPRRPDKPAAEKARQDLLARPPIYERRTDTSDEIWKRDYNQE